MFSSWTSATDAEIADALRSQRTIMDPDYTVNDSEDVKATDRYESVAGTWEDHPHYHINAA